MKPGNDLKARVAYFANWDYNIKIAGVSFHQRELGKLYETDWNNIEITLVADPNNKVDPNAIQICADGEHIGFIPALVAPHLKSLIDNGQKFECALVYITDGRRGSGIRTGKIALRKV